MQDFRGGSLNDQGPRCTVFLKSKNYMQDLGGQFFKKWVVDFGQKSVSHLNYMQHHVAELYATSMCLLPAYSQCSTSRPNFSRSVSVERVLGPRPLRRGRSNFKTSWGGAYGISVMVETALPQLEG